MIWYSFSAAIIAVTVFYCLSVGRTPLLTFSRLSGGLGSQLAENVFIWAFLGFPAVGALLVFSFGRTATSSLRRLIYAGGLAGLVCSLLVYSGTRLLIALDMGFPNIGVTIFSLAFTYLLCFMGFSWCVRKLFETRYQQKQK